MPTSWAHLLLALRPRSGRTHDGTALAIASDMPANRAQYLLKQVSGQPVHSLVSGQGSESTACAVRANL